MFRYLSLLTILCTLSISNQIDAQKPNTTPLKYWHDKERSLRYKPDGTDFVIENGKRRFNRALYGGNTAFRVEAGDLPEFALYMPGMGGNLKLGIVLGTQNKWLIEADKIEARYRAGSMLYEISDAILGKGSISLTIMAQYDTEGLILKASGKNLPENLQLVWVFGGASGKRFSRDGDMNVDPESSFYLTPDNCKTNTFEISGCCFKMLYGKKKVSTENDSNTSDDTKDKGLSQNVLTGLVSPNSEIKIADARKVSTPLTLLASDKSETPVIAGKISVTNNEPYYFLIQNPDNKGITKYAEVPAAFESAEKSRQLLANRIKVETPDPYINTLGPIIGIAGDAIYENPTYLHGAIGWRIRLNGWRGPYTGDALGWHDRAESHLAAYAKSQIVTPETGPIVPDPKNNLSREEEKIGNSMFTSGYICRNPEGKLSPHHYDMNLVYIDAMLRHFQWTGDLEFAKKMWPVLQRHLAWEKRNYDGDNDGLYDAYCCIWASDALQYNGGAVTHSSAYNYYANKMAAKLAKAIGENAAPYQAEADKILTAINSRLWMPSKGWYAEYQDGLGYKRLHPSAALWTIYHTLDSEVPDMFQAYQSTQYVDAEIPHISIVANNLTDDNYYTLSTTNWMPYEWSINNVVPAEVFHTSLAYWQAGRTDDAFKLWKSNILDAMYLGGCPGNFLQISTYDAARGEAYRDFADCVGMASRSLIEGLFGIRPDALDGVLNIRPGLPVEWNKASLETPDISFNFKREGNKDIYVIESKLPKPLKLNFRATALREKVKSISVNGKKTAWTNVADAIEYPQIEIVAEPASKYEIVMEQSGEKTALPSNATVYPHQSELQITFGTAKATEVKDVQGALSNIQLSDNKLTAQISGAEGHRTVFVKLSQGDFSWWAPINFEIKDPICVEQTESDDKSNISIKILNTTSLPVNTRISINPGKSVYTIQKTLVPGQQVMNIEADKLTLGSNLVRVEWENGNVYETVIKNWNLKVKADAKFEKVDLSKTFNDKLTNIFKNEYLSPRWKFPTLALPKQGYGNWCYNKTVPEIDDSVFRSLAGSKNEIVIPQGVPFATPSAPTEKNILFTSLWDNYPKESSILLSGSASHAYLLMTGTSYHMQSQMSNAEIVVEYTDGTTAKLELRNPDTWWPIERDYESDGYAFKLNEPRPVRVHFKTDFMSNSEEGFKYGSLKGVDSDYIPGGAATVYDLPLDASKQLKSLTLKTLSYELIVGLMAVTLER